MQSFRLTASVNLLVSFEVTIGENGITNITGTITLEGGVTLVGPGRIEIRTQHSGDTLLNSPRTITSPFTIEQV